MTRVVAILAHPDDAEILAGVPSTSTGSAATASRSGVLRIRPILCAGRRVPRGPSASGQILRAWASPIWGSRYTPEDVGRLTAFLLAPTRPGADALARGCPPRPRGQCAAAYRGARTLCGGARVGGRRRQSTAFPQVWSCDTYGGLGSRGAFDPEWYIDISAVWEQKLQALAAHQSQTPAHWTELIRRHNAFYGARCNRQYAEGFRRLPLAL